MADTTTVTLDDLSCTIPAQLAQKWEGTLYIHAHRATDLKIGDITTSDPYVKISVKYGDEVLAEHQTKVINNSLNPTWDEEFVVVILPRPAEMDLVVNFEVWDRDRTPPDDFLGATKITIPIGSDSLGKEIEAILEPRNQNDKGVKGTLNYSIDYTAGGALQGQNAYKRYANVIAGILRTSSGTTHEAIRPFYTYAVQIFHINDVFGKKRQGWNTNYDSAIKIYGQGATSAIVRQTIRNMHAELYKTGLQPSTKGYLRSGKDFLALLQFGWCGGRPRVFTYALLPTHMYFSETGASFFQDFTSKHAMHANAALEVVFAGEFHIRHNNGKFQFVIDNNSGTFSPSKDSLPLLKKVLELNFPDLEVIVYDFKDENLKKSLQEMIEKDVPPTM